jgi:hypothetical protein
MGHVKENCEPAEKSCNLKSALASFPNISAPTNTGFPNGFLQKTQIA